MLVWLLKYYMPGPYVIAIKSIINYGQWKLRALEMQAKEIILLPQTAAGMIYQQSEFC